MTNYRNNLNPDTLRPAGDPLSGRLMGVLSQHGGSFWQVLWERRLVLAGALIVSVAAAVVYLVRATPLYSSESQLYVEQKGPRVMSDEEGLMAQSKNYLNTQCELLHSPAILTAALEGLDPASLPLLYGQSGRNGPMQILQGAIRAGVDPKSDIIKVEVRSPRPAEAALLVNKVVEAYIRYHSQEKKTLSRDILEILNREKQAMEQQRQSSTEAILKFTREYGAVTFDSQEGRVVDERLKRLSQALTDAEIETLQARADYQALNAMMADPDRIRELVESRKAGGQYDGSGEARLYDERATLLRQFERLQREGTPDHPEVQATRARLAQLERELEAMDNRYAQACRNGAIHRWVAAMGREEQIRAEWQQQRQTTQQTDARAAEYSILQAERERAIKSCDLLDSRIKELNIAGDTGGLNIKVLQWGETPRAAAWPIKQKVASNAVLIGLLLGIMLVLLLDWLDQRVRDAGEVAALLGVSVLGAVPGRPRSAAAGDMAERLRAHGQTVQRHPGGRVAEAYRSIRAAILYGMGLGQARPMGPGKTILVTSADPGDGKSTLVSNLALILAQAGQRVLIVDGDLRKPDQYQIFDVYRKNDLASVLAGRCGLDEAIMPRVAAGVDLLPSCAVPEWNPALSGALAGQTPAGPAELLSGPAFRAALDWLAERYDCILIDSPPALHVADALIMASLCDQTLLVLRAGKTTRRSVQQVRDGLLGMGAVIMGAVVNDVAGETRRYGYHPGYGYPGPAVNRAGRAGQGHPADAGTTITTDQIEEYGPVDYPGSPRERGRR